VVRRGCPNFSSLVPKDSKHHPLPPSLLFTPEQQRAVQLARAAEQRRFGLPIWKMLAGGLLGVGVVAYCYTRSLPKDAWTPRQLSASDVKLTAYALVRKQHEVEALLSEVRVVLSRHGIGIGEVPLTVRLMADGVRPYGRSVEGATTKVIRPPPVMRGIEAVSLQPGLTAIHTAQVLAHEYMHCWLWLHGFPAAMEPKLEEGLCELISYLYLLSCLKEPLDCAVIERNESALRQQIASIEANAHPDYGGGFRECVQALRGRQLHQLLSYVREHAHLPPPAEHG
jgi:hypothetical protein